MSKKIIGILAAIAVVVIIVFVVLNKPEMPAQEEELVIKEDIVKDAQTESIDLDSLDAIEVNGIMEVDSISIE